LRTISPISAATCRSPPESLGLESLGLESLGLESLGLESLGPGFAGRPWSRAIAARFRFFSFIGRFFGISTPYSHSNQVLFSDKYLKK
jgi:hypothetical protein